MRRVVVTGMGVVSPVGNDIPTFWDAVCNGRSGVRSIDRFDTTGFPTRIAGLAEPCIPEGMTPKDVRRRDRYTQYAMIAGDQAWRQAGVDMAKEVPERCGAIIGSGIGGIATLEDGHQQFLEDGHKHLSPVTIPKLLANIAAGETAIRYGLRGPNKSVVTACATGAQCISEAVNMIRLGQADVMMAGGSEAPITAFAVAGFCAMKAMSRRNEEPQRASRPFDADRDGFVMGEGAGLLILESEEHARARGGEILGEVAGLGETSDAYHITAPAPDGSGVAAAMRIAINDAGLNPSDVGYINAHGTSTRYNDATESLAFRQVYGEKSMPPVSSTKSMMGHLVGAAGSVEAIICLLAIRDGILPPSINYDTPDPGCVVNLVANQARQARVDVALSNSLGFGGHNASLILKRYA